LNDLYKSVILHTTEDDNPVTKLRALMLKTVSGKRDLGQCEVCRLLMSQPLYHSSFEYITVSLDFKQTKQVIPITEKSDENDNATYENLMEEFAKRNRNKFLEPILHKINNYYSFVKYLKIAKGKIIILDNFL
jgi:hypothetical protein